MLCNMGDVVMCLVVSMLALLLLASLVWGGMDSCYEDGGSARRCMPRFENAAFNRTVIASNTCGLPPESYCLQAGSSTRSCRRCDASNIELHHNATYLTDFHSDEEPSWWQSQSMFYSVQYPNSVNLTLQLGKAFDITYIRLKFQTSRPESFAIYKRTKEGGPWVPYQYYSASCMKSYSKDPRAYLQPGDDERAALCTDEFSDISPLTGGNVAFSTLEGRPSAYNFDHSFVLQDWVTATDILISFNRLNTFGDEFFKDANVLRSYFYAISDFSVGGRCKCNGHASECFLREDGRLTCACQHHTAGADCHECQPFYQDRPWARATADSAHQCVQCNCSGRTDECVFDAELYRSTGSGGRCVDCRDNTDGPHCERCKSGFHRNSAHDICLPCNCHPLGSVSLQCSDAGLCHCRGTVTGEKCDGCQPGFHSLGASGCRPCECHPSGTLGVCDAQDGTCSCREKVEGPSCDRCKPGFFNLAASTPAGCQPCFCYGHSTACTSASRYTAFNITSDFVDDPDGWVGEFQDGKQASLIWKEGEVYLLPYTEDDIGFYRAPRKFMGNQQVSYGQLLSLTFSAESKDLLPQTVSVILEGSDISVSAKLVPEPVAHPTLVPHSTFRLRLHEEEKGLSTSLSSLELHHLLHNITTLKISNAGGLNYTSQLAGVTLVSALPSISLSSPAPWVEQCTCPPGFQGHFCQHCAPGYRREVAYGGPFTSCVPCTCNQRGDCHPETGECHCMDFTTGPSCERCMDGYYGNALSSGPGVCQPCPCPEQSICLQLPETGEVICTNCPPGHRGIRCEVCDDGYYGDPASRPCIPCECSGNVDLNAVGVCHTLSGHCLKCLYHTEGQRCERCKRGYYGNAVVQEVGDKCKPCSCNSEGTNSSQEDCHPQTGQCLCLPHVSGRDCAHCGTGYFNLRPVLGCEKCKCSQVGSSSVACHPVTGQCMCRPGVEGLLCNACKEGFFGLSKRGCRACNCDPMGSITMQCHNNGTCSCRQGFTGYKCDKCMLNYYRNWATHQCEECPVCYGLVRDQVANLRRRLQALEKVLSSYDCANWRGHHHLPLQGEDTLPNTLMEFLAIQDAKKAFISEFTQLESSLQMLWAHLQNMVVVLNCTSNQEERERGPCRALINSVSAITEALTQLGHATQTLDSMVLSFEVSKGPNQWSTKVTESRGLLTSHEEIADLIESIVKDAVHTSEQSYNLLLDFLEDNATELFIHTLRDQLQDMHQTNEELTVQVNQTWSQAHALNSSIHADLGEITELSLSAPLLSLRADPEESLDLVKRTLELDKKVQEQDQLVRRINVELKPPSGRAEKHTETLQEYAQMIAQVEGAKVTAVSSVVKVKETESEAIALLRDMEGVQDAWSGILNLGAEAQAKEKMVKDTLLIEAREKTSQAEEMVRNVLENSTLVTSTAAETEATAISCVREAKNTLVQLKRTRTVCTQLSSSVDMTLEQLEGQEQRAAQALEDNEEGDASFTDTIANIETAKLQLEMYMQMLSELLGKTEENGVLGHFDQLLSKTSRRLSILRHNMESPGLKGKLELLQQAKREQHEQLEQVELSIHVITEERRSLMDMVQHLSQGCATDLTRTDHHV